MNSDGSGLSTDNNQVDTATITLGGGCFWCLEAVYQEITGVIGVESGYANGHYPNPTYQQVCTGETGHVEVVKVDYDPRKVDLESLLTVFFVVHDPTTLNRQGNDIGAQYRSGIYVSNPGDAEIAKRMIAKIEAQKLFDDPLVTEVEPLRDYSKAEAYHQNYYRNNPLQGYCAFVVGPKVAKFRQQFAQMRRSA